MGGDVVYERCASGSVFRFSAVLPLPAAGKGKKEKNMSKDDRDKLDQVSLFLPQEALAAFDGDKDFMLEVCKVLLEDMKEKEELILQGLEQNEVALVLRNVHALKNSAATLKCERLRIAGAQLESALRALDSRETKSEQAGQVPDMPSVQVHDWLRIMYETEACLQAFLAAEQKGS